MPVRANGPEHQPITRILWVNVNDLDANDYHG